MPNSSRPGFGRTLSDAPAWLTRLLWALPGLAAAALCAVLSCGGPVPEAVRVVGAGGPSARTGHSDPGPAQDRLYVRVEDPAAIDVVRLRPTPGRGSVTAPTSPGSTSDAGSSPVPASPDR